MQKVPVRQATQGAGRCSSQPELDTSVSIPPPHSLPGGYQCDPCCVYSIAFQDCRQHTEAGGGIA